MAQLSSAEKANAKRVAATFGIPGPIASIVLSGMNASSGATSRRSGRLSDSTGGALKQRTRFLTTKTEDAMDGGCIVPCALEEWFRPVLQNNKFGNPDKLKFRYSAH
jgi:hypothetical protein